MTARILYLTYNFPPKLGGMEQVILRVAEALDTSSECVFLAQAGAVKPTLKGVQRSVSWPGIVGFCASAPRIGRQLHRDQPFDLVVAASGTVAWPAARLAKRFRVPAVLMTYGLDVIYPNPLYQHLFRKSLPSFKQILTISSATGESIKPLLRPDQSLARIPPGCDYERFEPCVDRPVRRGEEGPLLLHAGRLVPRKGMAEFVRHCLPLIREKCPSVRLLVAGGNPEGSLAHHTDQARLVDEAAREVGVDGIVQITGRLTDKELLRAYHEADLFVMPNIPDPDDVEGFGIVLLEAAAAGLPVVATRLGGIPNAVADGKNGCLVPPGNWQAFADEVVNLWSDPTRRTEMGHFGRERVRNEFNWPLISSRYAEAILATVELNPEL